MDVKDDEEHSLFKLLGCGELGLSEEDDVVTSSSSLVEVGLAINSSLTRILFEVGICPLKLVGVSLITGFSSDAGDGGTVTEEALLLEVAFVCVGGTSSIGSSLIFLKLSNGNMDLNVLKVLAVAVVVLKLRGALKLCVQLVEVAGAAGVMLIAPFEFLTKSKRSDAVVLLIGGFDFPTLLLLLLQLATVLVRYELEFVLLLALLYLKDDADDGGGGREEHDDDSKVWAVDVTAVVIFGAILTRFFPDVEDGVAGLIVTLPHVMLWTGFGAIGVTFVGAILTKAGVGIWEVFDKFVAVAALKPGAGNVVRATGCWTLGVIVGTNGGGVVGVAIIFPLAVVIFPVLEFFVVFPIVDFNCWACAFGDRFW